MIVQCEKCQTKFNVNDDLIKSDGSKVKCSRCANVFLVYPPEPIGEALEKPDMPADEDDLVAETDTSEAEPEIDLDFDDNFEDDIMEDYEYLETEYQSDPVSFDENTEMEVQYEDDEEESLERVEEEKENIPPASGKKKKGNSQTLLILCIIVLGLIGAAYAVSKYFPNLVPDFNLSENKPASQPKSMDAGASRLEILTVDGSFVDSKKTGRLFVISGKVNNGYTKSRSFILVKGCILNDKGQIVKEETAFAGNILSEEELISLPLEEVGKVMKNRYGVDKKNVTVTSGTSVDFMIVFDDLPDNLTEFTVGAVSSSPGSPESNH
jgi:predicted Zn finger-like uncharacterized protein